MRWHEILKSARISKELSLRQVEKQTDISNAYVSQLENGKIKDPSFFKMLRLLFLYEISVRDMGNEQTEITTIINTDFCEKCDKLRILDIEEFFGLQAD